MRILTLAFASFLGMMACGETKPVEKPDDHAEEAGDGHDEHEQEAGEHPRVTLTVAAEQTAGIVLESLTAIPRQEFGASLVVPGKIEFDPRRVAVISSRVSGRLEHVDVVEGDRVRERQAVASIFSPEYITAQGDYQQAIRRANVLRGTDDAQGANALAAAARRRLAQLGVSDTELSRLAGGGEPRNTLTLTAPFAGSILSAEVLPGAAVEAGMPVFRIADLSMVDIIASVPERAMASVRVGQPATVTIAAYPTLRFSGHIERLRDMLDSTTRTVGAVVHVLNPSRTLRPGMYATVSLGVPNNTIATADARVEQSTGDMPPTLLAPESAVVTDGTRSYVFVHVAPRTYERREVTATVLAPASHPTTSTSGRVALTGDIRVGERVVVRGAFTLKSELVKGQFKHDH